MAQAKVKTEIKTAKVDPVQTANQYRKQYAQDAVDQYIRNDVTVVKLDGVNKTMHRQSKRARNIEDIAKKIDEVFPLPNGTAQTWETYKDSRRRSNAKSRSTANVNMNDGSVVFTGFVNEFPILEALEVANLDIPAKRDYSKVVSVICHEIFCERIFIRAGYDAIQAGDDATRDMTKLARISSGGRLNAQFEKYARQMGIWDKFVDGGREGGQDAHKPTQLTPKAKKAIKAALEVFDPTVWTTKAAVSEGNPVTNTIELVRVAAPIRYLQELEVKQSDGVFTTAKDMCYFQSIPKDTLNALGGKFRSDIPFDGGKKLVTFTVENYKTAKVKGYAPKTKRDGTLSAPAIDESVHKTGSTGAINGQE